MMAPADFSAFLVLALATCMIASQLYFPPRVETTWRARLRVLFYLGAAVVVGLVAGRLYEFYRAVGL